MLHETTHSADGSIFVLYSADDGADGGGGVGGSAGLPPPACNKLATHCSLSAQVLHNIQS